MASTKRVVRSGYTKRVEVWNINDGKGGRRNIVKAAVRNSGGQFHGATNFNVRPNATIEG